MVFNYVYIINSVITITLSGLPIMSEYICTTSKSSHPSINSDWSGGKLATVRYNMYKNYAFFSQYLMTGRRNGHKTPTLALTRDWLHLYSKSNIMEHQRYTSPSTEIPNSWAHLNGKDTLEHISTQEFMPHSHNRWNVPRLEVLLGG